MAVAGLGNHGFEGIEHVEIGAGIEVGCGQCGRGVEDEYIADSGCLRVVCLEHRFDGVGDVEDFALLAGFDGEFLHDQAARVTFFEALNSLRKTSKSAAGALKGRFNRLRESCSFARWGSWTSHSYSRLAPWAVFLRRFAANNAAWPFASRLSRIIPLGGGAGTFVAPLMAKSKAGRVSPAFLFLT